MANHEFNFLPLTEYSSKHKVSISTLRRRIKSNDIKYRFDEGKYFIFDEPVVTHQGIAKEVLKEKERRPSQENVFQTKPFLQNIAPPLKAELSPNTDEPIFNAANKLIAELKRAYTQSLQDKEEQILQLKEEIADLKTLVRVLDTHKGAEHHN